MMTKKELAAHLNVSVRTIDNLIARRRLPIFESPAAAFGSRFLLWRRNWEAAVPSGSQSSGFDPLTSTLRLPAFDVVLGSSLCWSWK